MEPHKRSKRSLTALLAAEVLFLERILAAQQQKQNSRKPRKIVRPASVINNNKIEAVTVPRVKTKNKPTLPSITAPPVQIFKFGPPPPQATGTKFKSLPSLSVSSLDPFTMMKAPDLSKNSYGEYELYQTLKPASSSYSSSLSSSFQFEPEIVTEIQESQSARQPKKRKLHYGAFELYQLWTESWCQQWNKVKNALKCKRLKKIKINLSFKIKFSYKLNCWLCMLNNLSRPS